MSAIKSGLLIEQKPDDEQGLIKFICELLKKGKNQTSSDILEAISDNFVFGGSPSKPMERVELNRLLNKYDGMLFEKNESTQPPTWRIKTIASETKSVGETKQTPPPAKHMTIVLVDLGHMHGICSKIEALNLDPTEFACRAYADFAYNGEEVSKPDKFAFCKIWKSPDNHTNTADVRMLWDMAELSLLATTEHNQHVQFVIMSKDKIFAPCKTMLAQVPNQKVEFVSTWDQLKLYLE